MKSLDAYAAYLAQQHAQDQEQIAGDLARAMFPLWAIVQFHNLSQSMTPWLASVLPRIQTAYTQSQRVSAVFTQNVRFASLPTEAPLPISVPDVQRPAGISAGAFDMPDLGTQTKLLSVSDAFDTERVATSLIIQADYKTKLQMPGQEDELMHNALVRSSGTAVREAINGARGVVDNANRIPRSRIIGYARVTDSKPCYFCALLASRGAVYTKDSFLKSDQKFTANPSGAQDLPEDFHDIAKVHNNCKCTLRPVYSKSSAIDDAAKHYKAGWKSVYSTTKTNRGDVNNFRKWLENNPYQGSQADLYRMKQDLNDREVSLIQAGFSHDSPQVKWAAQQLSSLVSV